MRRLFPTFENEPDVRAAYDDVERWRQAGRAYVLVNMVASSDGATAVDGVTGKLGSPADKHVFHLLRSLADVILVGAQTVRAEGYGPPKTSEEEQARRVARGQDPLPRIAVVSRSLELDWSSKLFTAGTSRPYVVVPAAAEDEARRRAGAAADVVVAGDETVDMGAALAALHDHGATVVLCEGGPMLNAALVEAGCIDELCLTVTPALVGGASWRGILGPARLDHMVALGLVHVLEDDGFLFLRYAVGGRGPSIAAPPAGAVAQVGSSIPAAVVAPPHFAEVVADLDYPMAVVTAADGDERAGCLVGFAAQCSISPPRFMVWLSKKNHTYRVAQRSRVLAVHLLSTDDLALAELFGTETGETVDKLERVPWREGPGGAPVLTDCARWFAGRVVDRTDTGDHVGFLVEPFEADAAPWAGQLGFQAVRHLDPGHEA